MPRIKYHNFDSYARRTYYDFLIDNPRYVAIDTETTGFTWRDRPFGVSIAWRSPHTLKLHSGWFELDDPDAAKSCGWFFDAIESDHTVQVYFNAKFDVRMLINVGMLKGWPEYWDDMIIPTAYCRPSGQRDLKSTARDLVRMTTNEDEVLKKVRRELKLKKDDGYFPIPREYIIPYAEKDARMTLCLYEHFDDTGMLDKWTTQFAKERKLLKITTEMEFAGLQVKRDQLKAQIRRSDEVVAATTLAIESYVGKKVGKDAKAGEFNPGSHIQLKQWIKDTYDIELPDIQASTLKQYNDRIPMLNHLSILRKEEKLRNTYLRPALKELDKYDILHPVWNPFGTNTGRFSAGGDGD